jgi:hypothetical protein
MGRKTLQITWGRGLQHEDPAEVLGSPYTGCMAWKSPTDLGRLAVLCQGWR